MSEPSDPRRRKLDAGTRVEAAPDQLLDFSNCHGLAQVADRLVVLRDRELPIQTSSGPLIAEAVGRGLYKALDQIWKEQRDLYDERRKEKGGGYVPGQLPLLLRDRLDTILAQNGITSTGGLRAVITQSLSRGTTVSQSFLDPMNNLLRRGEHNPIWRLNDAAFAQRYPESDQPADLLEAPATEPGIWGPVDDTSDQVRLRWEQTKDRRSTRAAREKFDSQRDWERRFENRNWDFDNQVIKPTFAAGEGQERYTGMVAAATALDNQAKAHLDRARAAEHTLFDTAFTKKHSIAAKIERAFTEVFAQQLPGRRAETQNTIQTAEQDYPAIARTLEWPINHQPNATMRVTLLSQVDQQSRGLGTPKEMAASYVGVVLESIAGVSLLARGRPSTPDQFQAFGNAWQQLKAVEDQVRRELGLELNIIQHLRKFAPPSR